MFKPLPMQRVSLKVLSEDIPQAAQALAQMGMFNPEMCEAELTEQLPDSAGENYRRLFASARNRFEKLIDRIPFAVPPVLPDPQPISLEQLQTLDQQLGEIWQQYSQLEEKAHQLKEQQTSLSQLFDTLDKFFSLDIDLSLLQRQKRFLNLHIGTVDVDNLQHLKEALTKAAHFIDDFHRTKDTVYCIIAGPLSHQEDVKAVLDYAEFRALVIPDEFHSHPQQVHQELSERAQQIKQQLQDITDQQLDLIEKYQGELTNAYQLLYQATPYAQLTETTRGRGSLTLIQGWIPKKSLPDLEQHLKTQFQRPYVLHSRDPLPEERQQVPTLMNHAPWFKAYESLVKNYGIPRYGEFDPTLLFMVSFLLMFGVMFGDVGQGAVIMLFGWWMRKKLKAFSIFFIGAGFFSVIFGFLYGSIFGVEEKIIPALWVSPLHHPFYMLTVALYWGIGFILVMTLIKVINNWREGHHGEAVFNSNGLAGIFLYLGGFLAIKNWMTTGEFNQTQQLAIVLPLLVILSFKWYENKLPIGERILVTLIEGFETIINYLANTLSFLRIAAFSLNHVALAITVFTLAEMMGDVGYWVMAVIGNLIIIVLEGAIVTIQVLRLEYYEGFSRFFRGDGRAFKPLQLGFKL